MAVKVCQQGAARGQKEAATQQEEADKRVESTYGVFLGYNMKYDSLHL